MDFGLVFFSWGFFIAGALLQKPFNEYAKFNNIAPLLPYRVFDRVPAQKNAWRLLWVRLRRKMGMDLIILLLVYRAFAFCLISFVILNVINMVRFSVAPS